MTPRALFSRRAEFGPYKNSFMQVTKNDFMEYAKSSDVFMSLDKNKDGIVSATEMTTKAELAFKVKD